MSVHVQSKVWEESALSGGPLLTLIALADSAGIDGVVFWSENKLAQKVRRSERQVRRDIRAAEDAGEIQVRKARRKGSRTWFNVYRFRWFEAELVDHDFVLREPFTTGHFVRSSAGTTGQEGLLRPDMGVRLNVSETNSEAYASANGNGKVSEQDVQVLWRAIEAEGIKAPVAKSPRSSFAKLVRELVAVHASEDDVRRWTKLYRAHPTLGKTMLTLPALVKWAPQLESDVAVSDPAERLRKRLSDLEKRGVIPA